MRSLCKPEATAEAQCVWTLDVQDQSTSSTVCSRGKPGKGSLGRCGQWDLEEPGPVPKGPAHTCWSPSHFLHTWEHYSIWFWIGRNRISYLHKALACTASITGSQAAAAASEKADSAQVPKCPSIPEWSFSEPFPVAALVSAPSSLGPLGWASPGHQPLQQGQLAPILINKVSCLAGTGSAHRH